MFEVTSGSKVSDKKTSLMLSSHWPEEVDRWPHRDQDGEEAVISRLHAFQAF